MKLRVVVFITLIFFGCMRQKSYDLLDACEKGNLQEAIRLVKAGADVNVKDENGGTPLMYATTISCSLPIIKLLLSNGADVNTTSDEGETALMFAAGLDRSSEIIVFLIDNGAEVNAKCSKGETPFFIACRSRNIDNVTLFLSKNADPNIITNDGITGLDYLTKRINRLQGRIESGKLDADTVENFKQQIDKSQEIITLLKNRGAKTAAELKAEEKLKKPAPNKE